MDNIRVLFVCCLLISAVAATCNNTVCDTCNGGSGKCSQCKTGYYLDNFDNCIRCSDMCLLCKEFAQCDQCDVGSYKDIDTDGNSFCATCSSGCTSCESDAQCTTCKTGYYGVTCAHACSEHCVDDACTNIGCTKGCTDEYYKHSDNVCKRCLSACKTCSNLDTCDSCKPVGRYGPTCLNDCINACPDGTCDISTGRCGITCPEGQYLDKDGQCSPCIFPCKSCVNDSTTCTKCEFDYYLDGTICKPCYIGCNGCTGKTICPSCKDRFYRLFQGCAPCSTGCVNCTSSTQCTECKEAYYLTSGQCFPCTPPCKACVNSSTTCTQCEFGFYLDRTECKPCYIGCNGCTGKAICPSCKDGYYRLFHGCAACSATCATCTSSTRCTTCTEGYYMTSGMCCPSSCNTCTSSGGCKACKPGYHLESGQCHTCSSSCATCKSYPDCITCTHGFYMDSQECRLCDASCATCSSYPECASCNQGDYLESQQCHRCPSVCASCTSNTECTSCKDGYYLSTGQCHQCNPDCKDQQCDSDGNCMNGCASSSRFGPNCNMSCTETIPGCSVCHSAANGVTCAVCERGFVLGYNTGVCKPCSTNCKYRLCYPNSTCVNGCINDWYGLSCNMNCKESFQHCLECNTTVTLVKCLRCDTGFRLESDHCVPNKTCSTECKDGTCDFDGKCTHGCLSSDIYGPKCDKSCSKSFDKCNKCGIKGTKASCESCHEGYFPQGDKCVQCPDECKDNTVCNQGDGACIEGCKHGWAGYRCLETCPRNCLSCLQYSKSTCDTCTSGFYGISCENTCGNNCMDNTTGSKCSKDEGSCVNGCTIGSWGARCDQTCNNGCLSSICFQDNGRCYRCKPDKYGTQCDKTCSEDCVRPGNSSSVCRQSDGVCVFGCSPGTEGQECSGDIQAVSDREYTTTSTTAWVVTGVACTIFAIVVVVAVVRFRKLQIVYGSQESDVPLQAITSAGQRQGTGRQTETSNNLYADLSPAPERDSHLYATTHAGPGTSGNVYADLTPAPGRNDHLYGTARMGPHTGSGTSDGHHYANLTVE